MEFDAAHNPPDLFFGETTSRPYKTSIITKKITTKKVSSGMTQPVRRNDSTSKSGQPSSFSSSSSSSIVNISSSSQRPSQPIKSSGGKSQAVEAVRARIKGYSEEKERRSNMPKRSRSPSGQRASGSTSSSQSNKGEKNRTKDETKDLSTPSRHTVTPAPFPLDVERPSSLIIDDDPYARHKKPNKPRFKPEYNPIDDLIKESQGDKKKKGRTGQLKASTSTLDSPDPLAGGLTPQATPTKAPKTSGTTSRDKAPVMPTASQKKGMRPLPPRKEATSTARPSTSRARPAIVPDSDVSESTATSDDDNPTPRAKGAKGKLDPIAALKRRLERERQAEEFRLEKEQEEIEMAMKAEDDERALKRKKELEDPDGGAMFFSNLLKQEGRMVDTLETLRSGNGRRDLSVDELASHLAKDPVPPSDLPEEYKRLLQTKGDDLEGYSEEDKDYLRTLIDPDARCQFCNGRLPRVVSAHANHLGTRLALLRSESGAKALPWQTTIEYCALHEAETTTVPLGLREGYPGNINFAALQDRVEQKWIRRELEELMREPDHSALFNKVISDITRKGKGKWTGMKHQTERKVVDMAMPGYYGSLGRAILMRHFQNLHSWRLTPRLTATDTEISPITPLTPMEFFNHVVVPEAGIRLIMADQGWTGRYSSSSAAWGEARREAYKVWKASADFGRWKYRAESEEAKDMLDMLLSKDRETRAECRRRREEEEEEEDESEIIEVDEEEAEDDWEVLDGPTQVDREWDEDGGSLSQPLSQPPSHPRSQSLSQPRSQPLSQPSTHSRSTSRALSKRPSAMTIDGDEDDVPTPEGSQTPKGQRYAPIIVEDSPLVSFTRQLSNKSDSMKGGAKKFRESQEAKKGFARTISAASNASTDYGDEVDWSGIADDLGV